MEPDTKRIESRMAAILAADVAGYSRLMSQDEAGTLQALTAHREVMDRLIADHGGRIANTAGDSVLAEFASAVDAVQCAAQVQEALAAASQDTPEEKRLQFRIGVHVGDVMVRGGDLLGDGVNIAARLESIAAPGGICISDATYGSVRKAVPLTFTDLGPQKLKNIDEPVRAYALSPGSSIPAGTASAASPPLPKKPSIAVLPFNNMSGDPDQGYFADGIVEDIITALSRVRWLFVIARNSSFTYKNKSIDARQIGRELGARYLLEGSIRKAGQRIRISGQLLEAATGAHLWADRFDGEISEIFELQDLIATRVVIAVEPSLRSAETERAQRKPTDNLDAYDLYLRALPAINVYTRAGFEEAEGLLRRAVALDPAYADALAALAECLVRMVVNGWAADKQASTAEACALAGRAVTADPENASVLAIAAWAYSTPGRPLRTIARPSQPGARPSPELGSCALVLRVGVPLHGEQSASHRAVRGGTAAEPGRPEKLFPDARPGGGALLRRPFRGDGELDRPDPGRGPNPQCRAPLPGRCARPSGPH
jgi:adenylate cyclase